MLAPNRLPDDGSPDFETLGARFAFTYHSDGAKGLRELLTGLVESGRAPSEYLAEAGDELLALGIIGPARLVAEAAAQCPSLADVEVFCPYLVSPYVDGPGNAANIRMWLRARQRQIERIRERRHELLRRAGIEPESVDYTG